MVLLLFIFTGLSGEELDFLIYDHLLVDIPVFVLKTLSEECEMEEDLIPSKGIYGRKVPLTGKEDNFFYILLCHAGASGGATLVIIDPSGKIRGTLEGIRIRIKDRLVNHFRVIETESSISYREGIIQVYIYEAPEYTAITTIPVTYCSDSSPR